MLEGYCRLETRPLTDPFTSLPALSLDSVLRWVLCILPLVTKRSERYMSNFVLRAEELPELESHLKQHKWIAPDEHLISASIPGAGNMNYTLRIRSNFRTFIVKQSRSYVEKYPQIPAPAHRVVTEGRFYELIQEDDILRSFTPELSALDPDNNMIMLADLGNSSDLSVLYEEGNQLLIEELDEIIRFISVLHLHFHDVDTSYDFRNVGMRNLNAEHIFRYPFMEDNGFDLDTITPGLQAEAMRYKQDAGLKEKVASLSTIYLADGETLLHGDYYPGSWLRTYDGIRIIDPEFGFFGRAEFDVSVMLAHLIMARQPAALIQQLRSQYQAGPKFDWELTDQLAGVEIMRRIIGLAQLPLALDLAQKAALLNQAYQMII